MTNNISMENIVFDVYDNGTMVKSQKHNTFFVNNLKLDTINQTLAKIEDIESNPSFTREELKLIKLFHTKGLLQNQLVEKETKFEMIVSLENEVMQKLLDSNSISKETVVPIFILDYTDENVKKLKSLGDRIDQFAICFKCNNELIIGVFNERKQSCVNCFLERYKCAFENAQSEFKNHGGMDDLLIEAYIKDMFSIHTVHENRVYFLKKHFSLEDISSQILYSHFHCPKKHDEIVVDKKEDFKLDELKNAIKFMSDKPTPTQLSQLVISSAELATKTGKIATYSETITEAEKKLICNQLQNYINKFYPNSMVKIDYNQSRLNARVAFEQWFASVEHVEAEEKLSLKESKAGVIDFYLHVLTDDLPTIYDCLTNNELVIFMFQFKNVYYLAYDSNREDAIQNILEFCCYNLFLKTETNDCKWIHLGIKKFTNDIAQIAHSNSKLKIILSNNKNGKEINEVRYVLDNFLSTYQLYAAIM